MTLTVPSSVERRGYRAGFVVQPVEPSAPAAPTIGTITAQDSITLIVPVNGVPNDALQSYLEWSDTEGGTYTLYDILSANITPHEYGVTLPSQGATKWFRAKCSNEWGESSYSTAVSGTGASSGSETPGQVQGLRITGSTSSGITWEWDELPGVTSYTFQLWNGSNWTSIQTTGITAVTHTQTGLSAGTEYGGRVYAVNSGAASPNGPVSSSAWGFTASSGSAPTAGSISVSADSTSQLTVSQVSAGSGWDSLSLQMSTTGADGTFSEVSTSLPHSVTGLSASTTRWFRPVYTNTGSGLSTVGATVQGTTQAASSGDALYFDDFERSTLSGGPVGWGTGGNAFGETFLSTDRAKSGTRSIRFQYEATADTQDSSAELRINDIGSNLTEYCVRYFLWLPSNFYHRNATGSDNCKGIMQSWSGTYGAVASNQYIGFEYWPSSGTPGQSNISCRIGRDGVDLGHVHAGGETGSGSMFRLTERGKWIQFKTHIKLATGPGLTNGTIRVWKWVDGNASPELIFDKTNWGYSTRGNFIRSFYFLGWSNSGFNEETNFYLDRFSLHTSLLDWESF